VPTEDASTAQSIRIRSYPTEEYLGFIFAYFGDGDAPALPRYPDYEQGEIWTETYERPCNFFNNLENDPVHIPFAHRESEIFRTRPIDIPVKVQADESEWGITLYTTYSGDRLRTTQFGWPNIRSFKAPDRNHLVWRVPIDDVSHASFQLDVMHVTSGDQGEFYKQRHAARTGKIGNSYKELGEAILRGELRIQDIDGDDKANLIWIQDYVTQVGLGTFADRVNERLIRSDSGVLLYRKIWERELRALAENKPLKQWSRSETLTNAYTYHTAQ
jgi:5,5'-dehydrodivanillate O-demethylase